MCALNASKTKVEIREISQMIVPIAEYAVVHVLVPAHVNYVVMSMIKP